MPMFDGNPPHFKCGCGGVNRIFPARPQQQLRPGHWREMMRRSALEKGDHINGLAYMIEGAVILDDGYPTTSLVIRGTA